MLAKRYVCIAKNNISFLQNRYNDKKKIKREVSNVVKKYFSSQYTDSLSVFEDISQHLEGIELDAKDLSHLRKLLRLFFLGQLTGLPSLRCIMDSFGITSNNEQVKYSNSRYDTLF